MLALMIIGYYLLMVTLTVPDAPSSALGFSAFSLQQLGATHGASLLRGQAWRFVTSIFAHHDLLHIAFNLWALIAAGPLVEQIFDKKKMLLIYLVSGIASMAISHVWYTELRGVPTYVSAGASGAVCGLIGAAWFGAQRMGPNGAEVAVGMKRWTIYMVIWGFAVPGINNAAHFGGFVVAAALARWTPLGLAQSVAANKVLSVMMLGLLGLIGTSLVMMLLHLRGYPAVLAHDAYPRGILGMRYAEGAPLEQSDQASIWSQCMDRASGPPDEAALYACELNARANDHADLSWQVLADLHRRAGHLEEAQRLSAIAGRLRR
jgi:membrane associated rhomboid family serine protease